MDLGTLSQTAFVEFIKRLQGSGYTSESDSRRMVEVAAVAKIAELASETLKTASADLFLTSAVGALDAYEQVRFLVQSSVATERRRDRLIAFARGVVRMVEARLHHAMNGYLGGTGVTYAPGLDEAMAQRASPYSGLVVARRQEVAPSELDRRHLAPILQRGLPAHAIAGAISFADALYGHVLTGGLSRSITMFPPVTLPAQTKARTAPLEFYPGGAVSREQWIEIQSMLCWKSVGFDIAQDEQGRFVLFRGEVAASAQVAIDGPTHNGGVDWRGRVIQAWGVVSTTAITDPTTKTWSEHVWLGPSKSGPGPGYVHELFDVGPGTPTARGVVLFADGDGKLHIENNNASARHVALMLRCSPPYLTDTAGPTQPWINAAEVEHAELAELYASTVISDDEPGEFAGVPAGALRRIVYSGGIKYGGYPQSVVVDSSEDWRNRWVLVVPVRAHFLAADDNEQIGYPTIAADGATRGDVARLFYTGSGAATEQALPPQPFQHGYFPQPVTETNVWVYADLNGNLRVEAKDSTDPVYTDRDKAYDFMALVIATERDNGTSVVSAVPTHGTHLHTVDLEQPQNCGVYAQGQQGGVPRYTLDDPLPKTVPTNAPLGLVAEGHLPMRPVQWFVRERLGAVTDGTYLSRQKIFFQRKRLVSFALLPGAFQPVDDFDGLAGLASGESDQMDFRDRLVWVEGRYSTSDIRAGAASQLSDVSAGRFAAILYTGPHSNQSITLATNLSLDFTFSRQGSQRGIHSRMDISNASDTTLYVTMAIEVSGHLGLSDLRAVGQS